MTIQTAMMHSTIIRANRYKPILSETDAPEVPRLLTLDPSYFEAIALLIDPSSPSKSA